MGHETKLVEEILSQEIYLDYKILLAWRMENENILTQMMQEEESKNQHLCKIEKWYNTARDLYLTFQAFCFAFKSQKIETVSLRGLIYPCWRDVIGRYQSGDYDFQNLEVVRKEEHAEMIVKKAKQLQFRYASLNHSILLKRKKEINWDRKMSIAAIWGRLKGVELLEEEVTRKNLEMIRQRAEINKKIGRRIIE